MLPAVVAIATVALLSGCVPQEPVITPEPEPSSTPVFASDEEALAAATDAYAKYLEVSDQIAHDGGAGADRIENLVTEDWYPNELEQYRLLAGTGQHQVGSSAFENATLQRRDVSEAHHQIVVFYACLDLSGTRLVDQGGHDVTPEDVDLRSPFEITMNGLSEDSSELLLAGMERWSGSGVC